MQIAGDGEKRDHVKTRREEAGFFTYGVFILSIYLSTICKKSILLPAAVYRGIMNQKRKVRLHECI